MIKGSNYIILSYIFVIYYSFTFWECLNAKEIMKIKTKRDINHKSNYKKIQIEIQHYKFNSQIVKII